MKKVFSIMLLLSIFGVALVYTTHLKAKSGSIRLHFNNSGDGVDLSEYSIKAVRGFNACGNDRALNDLLRGEVLNVEHTNATITPYMLNNLPQQGCNIDFVVATTNSSSHLLNGKGCHLSLSRLGVAKLQDTDVKTNTDPAAADYFSCSVSQNKDNESLVSFNLVHVL